MGSVKLEDFYPRSPCGERPIRIHTCQYFFNFYPRSPCGERQHTWKPLLLTILFLSTLSLRRATHAADISTRREANISIHALLAESDLPTDGLFFFGSRFLSTLSLRRATLYINRPTETIIFLSTLSLRRATFACAGRFKIVNNFYPRSPCGERRYVRSNRPNFSRISIHALLAESDGILSTLIIEFLGFLSTLSLRRATVNLLS